MCNYYRLTNITIYTCISSFNLSSDSICRLVYRMKWLTWSYFVRMWQVLPIADKSQNSFCLLTEISFLSHMLVISDKYCYIIQIK